MNEVLEDARRRGITRLCHFTKSVNLPAIVAAAEIRSAADLVRGAEAFEITDRRRRDGRLDKICCTFEYPNTWYLDSARSKDHTAGGWVVLDLDLELIAGPSVEFSPVNAARGRGAGIAGTGLESFEAIFAPRVLGNRRRFRRPAHPSWWPTDDQAEVMVGSPVALRHVRGILVEDERQAETELSTLRQGGLTANLPTFYIAPTLFDKYQLSHDIRQGMRPYERLYTPDR